MEFREVCALFGGQRQVSRILGVSDRTVRRWIKEKANPVWAIAKLLEYLEEIKEKLIGLESPTDGAQ